MFGTLTYRRAFPLFSLSTAKHVIGNAMGVRSYSAVALGAALSGMLGLLALAVAVGCRGQQSPARDASQTPEQHPVVRVEAAQRRTITQVVQGLGYCEGLPDKTATLTAAVEGRVVSILVLPGATVKAGDPIVELDSAVAAANLAEKDSARDTLEAGLSLLQALPRLEEQKNYQLAVDATKLAVDKARAVAERLRPLRDRGEVSPQQMFEAELAVKQASVQQETAETQFKVAMLGARREAVEEAKAHIAAAAAAAATAKAQLELYTIRAPIDGVIDTLSCRLGQTLAAGASIGEVINLSGVYVQVWLPAPDARLVHPGQSAQIRLSASRNDHAGQAPSAAEQFHGTVAFVSQVVDPQTGNLPVRILVSDAEGRLAIGQTLAATITVAEKADVLAVPVEAIENLGEETFLRVVREEKSVRLRPPLGVGDMHWVEIAGSDLAEGEPVIVEGGYNLPEDAEVTVEPALEGPQQAAGEPVAGQAP